MNTYFIATLVKEAKSRGFVVSVINPEEPSVLLKTGKSSMLFTENTCNLIGAATHTFVNTRSLAGEFLNKYGFPLARWIKFSSKEGSVKFLRKASSVIVKPNRFHIARGISAAIEEPKDLLNAIKRANVFDREVVISEYVNGKEFKAITIGSKLVLTVEKNPPEIIGDGRKKIRKLIEEYNHIAGKNGRCTKVPVDIETWRALKQQKVDYDTILKANKPIKLRMFASHRCGAVLKDVANHFDNPILNQIKKIAKLLEAEVLSVDFVIPEGKKSAIIVDISTDIVLSCPFTQRITEALLTYIERGKK
jgi:D-alanine-D-alanine ligase-like ATP-grasp enzyme